MKKTIYKYFFNEFIRYFAVVLFALASIIWTIQAVNFLDLVTDDGHAFAIYLQYSFLTMPKVLTKLIPFSFLVASVLTILKFEKDNELIILWTSGLNKIHIVNLIFQISLLFMILQLLMGSLITPKTLNISRSLLKGSELQFVPSLLKERQFNDTVKELTVFVNKKRPGGIYENIFIRDEGKVLTQVSSGSSTIFAKSGYVTDDEKILVLLNGNIQKLEKDNKVSIIKFKKTEINLSGLSTKSISEPKIQETSTIQIVKCMQEENIYSHNCSHNLNEIKNVQIEINKRFGMPFFIPLISLVTCFLLSSRKDKKISFYNKYIYFFIAFLILISSEITVRYSGISFNHTAAYYLSPVILLPVIYFLLIKKFKYENLN
jgi:lipopolysaccharide export system permease protein